MRRFFAWFAGAAGGLAAYRALTRRPPRAQQPASAPDSRAEELRAKLAQAREAGDGREEFEAGETPVDQADPDARRRSVHEQGRAALDEMRGE